MQALDGESTARFVIRVDYAKRTIKVPPTNVYHAFVHKLDEPVRMLLDNIRMNKRAIGGGTVEWDDVVAVCRDSLAGVSLAQPNPTPVVATSSAASV